MRLAPFLLDQWLNQKSDPGSKIEFDLGSSTGPSWTLRELLELSGDGESERLLDKKLFYTPPAGTLELREAIAQLEGVHPEHVQIVTGAAEALVLLFFLAAEPGANVVLPNPGFPANMALAQSLGLEIRPYSLRPEYGFRINVDEIRGLVNENTRFVLVNSPHNPSGAVLSDQEMETLHDFCAGRGVPFVSDQVYHPIYHGVEMRSAARLSHATVLGDFSKALCLSGLRVGWIVERDAHRRELYLNARSYFSVSNTVLGEDLAALALRRKEAIYGRARTVAQKNLALLDQFFGENREIFHWVRPCGGMTAFPAIQNRRDAREFCTKLAKQGVLLAPGDCFGMPAHFRIGFGVSGDRFPEAVSRLAEFVQSEMSCCGSTATAAGS